MSTPSWHRDISDTEAGQEVDAHPISAPPLPDDPVSGSGIFSLRFAAAAFVTAPFLLLLPVSGFIPAGLAAAGMVFTWIGLRRSGRRPGIAVAMLIVSIMLIGLTLSMAIPWTRLVVVPAVSGYPEPRGLAGHVNLILQDGGGLSLSTLSGLLSGALFVAGGLLLRHYRQG